MAHIGTLAIGCVCGLVAGIGRVLTVVLLAGDVVAGVACRVARGPLCLHAPCAARSWVATCSLGAAVTSRVFLGACSQTLQLVHRLRDEWVREGELGRHTLVRLPLDAFLDKCMQIAVSTT